jgi:hypothetical protein
MDGAMNVSTEQDVGILKVIGANGTIVDALPPSACFTGIIKHRYTDFQVHEIDPTGTTLALEELPMPPVSNKRRKKQEFLGYSGIGN